MLQPSIPWEEYSEEEIHEIVEHLFTLRGYQVYNAHKADRRGEKGSDLVCVKTGEDSKILISVKKKPNKNDIYQLNELKNNNDSTKIYIYIKPPSADFYREIEKNKNIVSFWDSEKLTNELFNLDMRLYIFMIIEYYILKESYVFNYEFIRFYNEVEDGERTVGKLSTLDPEMLNILWNIKDRSVTFHKSLKTLQDLYEQTETLTLDKKNQINVINGYLYSLSRLKIYSILPLIKYMKRYIEKYPNNFAKYCKESEGRSNWLHLYNHYPKLLPNRLIRSFEKKKEEKKEMKSHFDRDEINYKSEDVAYLLADVSRILWDWPFWMEDATDDLLSISVSGEHGDFKTNFPDIEDLFENV